MEINQSKKKEWLYEQKEERSPKEETKGQTQE